MKKIFIIGVGRSGTTLLQSMLNAHKNIACPPESHFVRKYLQKSIPNKVVNIDKLEKILKEDTDLQRLNISFDEVKKLLNKTNKKTTMENIFLTYMKLYIKKENKENFGEKDPSNSNLLQTIYKFFPDAYILHIIRDPRDVVLSRKKSGWGKKTPFLWHVRDYKNDILKARKDGKELFKDKYQEIYYEELLKNSEKELIKICKFLEIDFDNSMLEYYKTSKKLFTNEEKQWKENITKPIIKNNTNKWKQELSKLEIMEIESICGNIMEELGYKKEFETNMFFDLNTKIKLNIFYVKKLILKIARKIGVKS